VFLGWGFLRKRSGGGANKIPAPSYKKTPKKTAADVKGNLVLSLVDDRVAEDTAIT